MCALDALHPLCHSSLAFGTSLQPRMHASGLHPTSVPKVEVADWLPTVVHCSPRGDLCASTTHCRLVLLLFLFFPLPHFSLPHFSPSASSHYHNTSFPTSNWPQHPPSRCRCYHAPSSTGDRKQIRLLCTASLLTPPVSSFELPLTSTTPPGLTPAASSVQDEIQNPTSPTAPSPNSCS